MSQSGLKHAATEPGQIAGKRDRRPRTAAGRAAALRRAPSDSDCSGETASLSADSGDRPPRLPPPTTRQAKSRSSRRRGSEWEVLEGLKDGQRFDKRPEVFNGYLHKKRKWPLKGWHKRFFVVDGGILVYARSPTDVARGRLHGSMDVGLSVISAKQRRRRIDIDADEFIYHLRAKTPDVFRTWLNVLKTHRLYRQHLLTFGAREPVPAIHPPLEDIQPTDSSSRTSLSSIESFSTISSHDEAYKLLPCHQSLYATKHSQIFTTPASPHDRNGISPQNCMIPYPSQLYKCIIDVKSKVSLNTGVLESAYSEENMSTIVSQSFDSSKEKFEQRKNRRNTRNLKSKRKRTENKLELKHQPLSAFFCFMRKKHNQGVQHGPSLLKGSKKSTNVVRYRNIKDEPTLRGPLSNCLLLGKYKFGVTRENVKNPKTRPINTYVSCNLVRFDDTKVICNPSPKSVKMQLDTDKVIDKLVRDKTENLLKKIPLPEANVDMSCVNQIVKNIYEAKSNICNLHPMLKVTLTEFIEGVLRDSNAAIISAPTCSISVDCPSKTYFTKDQKLSFIANTCVDSEVQCERSNSIFDCGIKKIIKSMKGIYDTTCDADLIKPLQEKPNPKNNSFERDQRIQRLERILRNTMYESGTLLTVTNQEDIEITKVLISSLDNVSAYNVNTQPNIDNTVMEELPKIQETINNIIREAKVSTEVVADFLNAYLNVLMENCSNNNTESSSSDSNELDTVTSKSNQDKPSMVSKSIATITNSKSTTSHDTISDHTMKPNHSIVHAHNVNVSYTTNTQINGGQHYLKDFLNKFTNILSNNTVTQNGPMRNCEIIDNTAIQFTPINIAGKKTDRDSLTIDLSKYHLDNVLMADDPADLKSVSVTIKLRRKLGYDNFNMYSNHSDDTVTPKTDLHYNTKVNLNTSNLSMHSAVEDEGNVDDANNTNNVSSRSLFHIYETSEESLGFSLERRFFQPFHNFDKQLMTQNLYNNECNQSCFIVSSFKKTSKQFLCHSKSSKDKPLQIQSSDSSSDSQSRDRVSPFDKTPPKTIDERFILLLLENLALLSKDLPMLHKDIRNIYIKLKKKYDKHMKSHRPGLSLLGKIYNEEHSSSSRCMDPTLQSETDESSMKNEFIQTAPYKIPKDTADKPINTTQLPMKQKGLQTDPIPDALQYPMKIYTPRKQESRHSSSQTFTSISKTSNVNEDKCVCTPNWAQMLKKDPSIDIFLEKINDPSGSRYYPDNPKGLKCCDNCCRGYPKYNVFPIYNIEEKWNLINLDNEDMVTVYRCESERSSFSGYVSPTSSQVRNPGYTPGTPAGRLAAWSLEAGGPLDNATRELGQAQSSIQQLQRLIDTLELQQQVHHDTDVSLDGASPNVKKDRRKFGLRKKKSNSKCASVDLAPPLHIDGSSSHMALSTLTAPPSPGGGATSIPSSAASLPIACAATRPQSLPGAESLVGAPGPASLTSLTPDQQLREDFTILAKDLVKSLKSVVATLVIERGRLRAAIDATESGPTNGGAMLTALRNNLNTALHQNSELRNRLSRIHDASDLAEISSVGPNSDAVSRQFQQSLSYSSSCVSASEFFDAEEHDVDLNPDMVTADQGGVIELDGDSSSEAGSLSSEEGSASSDNSDGALLNAEPRTAISQNGVDNEGWVRRKCLPCPRPTPGGPSLWNLLYKNIGKDLSQISMPVTINEPLNMLQRLCEELEYSELLDAAAECKNSIERMSLIAAFAVSAYAASAHRAASKPFNPLLAETYECVRDDRGFRFISEQVSHHPPISACHAASPRWCFWQEARIKTKFWGKSMEFQPAGRVHVQLHSTGDHYSWNKVTTCVHNLFGGQRWVDQYGDMHIMCHGTDITCKLNFIKASSWSTSRHEVRGAITAGGTRVRLAGRWSEALYAGDPPAAKCLWRPGAMPPEHELYYGFTRFAMELNELEPGMSDLLPHTDTRLRPDQRALEEGDVEAAEKYKHQLEQAQRERRRDSPEYMPQWFRKAVDGGDEMWVFNGEYWRERDAGFVNSRAPRIW